jgi:hypothetical protein
MSQAAQAHPEVAAQVRVDLVVRGDGAVLTVRAARQLPLHVF